MAEIQRRKLVEEYKWYLRGIDQDWAERWKNVWAEEKTEEIEDFDRKWVNPFWVLEKLKPLEIPLYCGSVHGDLHPRNVLLSVDRFPRLIDFGWAADSVHIAKDFVLLECNLRFGVLRPDISFEIIKMMAQWISFDAECLDLGDEYCDKQVTLIKTLRKIAKEHFPSRTDWDNEYILPLFLVALGLLKYLSAFDNQMAARLTVLSLAEYVDQKVLPKLQANASTISTSERGNSEKNEH